jgi:hypothetical protein
VRYTAADLDVGVKFHHASRVSRWDEAEAIEHWSAEICVFTDPANAVVLGWAELIRLEGSLTTDPILDLAEISYDMSEIASAVYIEGHPDLDAIGVYPCGNSTLLIATDVVIDPQWRGNRLGPSLVLLAAEILRADAIALTPAALRTKWSRAGYWVAPYELRRGDADDLAKVKSAWRRAGFRKLHDGVVWRESPDDHGHRARQRIAQFEKVIQTPEGLDWYRKRLRRMRTTS